MKKTFISIVSLLVSLPGIAQGDKMTIFIDKLMSQMTLEEKIGQLNLMVAGDIVTGAAVNTQVAGTIAAGKMGGVFNVKGADKIRRIQEVAVE